MNSASFGPELFRFLEDLADHNDRDWFAANKERYEADLLEPALAFIEDFEPHLREIAPHLRADARRVGGSLFRIYRDTRFSKDKTPYKTQVGIQFRHERAKDAHAPGFYLHLEPGSVFMACGTWHPDGDTLRAIRTAIAADADRWRAIVADEAFAGRFRLGGETLKRAPAGFDPDHPLIEDVKRKDFIAITDLSESDATSSGFLSRFLGLCAESAGFMRFLCDAARVPF
jgi:uncharacterized protein (TIGR02453 family)